MAQNDRKDAGRQSSGSTTGQAIQPRREGSRNELALRDPFAGFWGGDPFSTMRRLSEQKDRWFGDLGMGR